MVWIEDIRTKCNGILNGIRAFVAGLIRDPRGSTRVREAQGINWVMRDLGMTG